MTVDVKTLLHRSVRLYAHRPAVITDEMEFSFEDCWVRGHRLASWLKSTGISRRDRVATLESNHLGAIDTILALAILGATRVPLHPGADVGYYQHIYTNARCTALIVDREWISETEIISGEDHALVVRDESYEHALNRWSPVGEVSPGPLDQASELHVIRSTGGTTGRSKLVPYTDRQWLAACRDWFFALPQMLPNDRYLLASPLAHGGAYFFTTSWLSGSATIVPPNLSPHDLARAGVKHGATYSFMVPPVAYELVAALTELGKDFEMRALAIAGGPVSWLGLQLLVERFGNAIWPAYGLSEAVPISIMNGPELVELLDSADPRALSAGRVLAFADCVVVDGNRDVAPSHTIGEIHVHCDSQVMGYMVGGTIEPFSGRWIATGDAGWIDGDGFLHVVDRVDSTYIYNGRTIWLAQIEDAVARAISSVDVVVAGHLDGVPQILCSDRNSVDRTIRLSVPIVFPDSTSIELKVDLHRVPEPIPRTPTGKVSRRLAQLLISKSFGDCG